MTLRIFFWSNFLGKPWTVVNVLRPLRSVRHVSVRPGQGARLRKKPVHVKHTLDTDVDVVLRLLGFTCIFIGFGEGVSRQ